MKKMNWLFIVCIILSVFCLEADSGIIGYGICQSGCNTLVVACYAAAGYTFGTVTAGFGVPGL
jgi:hypothetical protein